MRFRRFNERGIKEFADFLAILRLKPETPVPTEMLTSPRFTDSLKESINAELPTSFASRMDFAKWMHAAAEANGVEIPRGDAGFRDLE